MFRGLRRRIEALFSTRGSAKHSQAVAADLVPDSPNPAALACCQAGFEHLKSSQPSEALAFFQKALAAMPRCADAYNGAGLALRALGRNDEARVSFERAIDIEPDHARALANHGMTCLELRRMEDAEDSLRLALAGDPDSAVAHLGLGRLCFEQQRNAEAIEHLERAARLDPESPVPLLSLSAIRTGRGEHDLALACLERVAVLVPDAAEIQCNLGINLLRLERPQEAAVRLRRAIALKEDFFEAHFNLGIALQECDDCDGAIQSSLRAIALRPDYAEAHDNLGKIYRLRSDPDKAVAAYQMALSLQPDFAEAQLHMGVMRYEQGRIQEAIACYQKALAIKPELPEAHINLGLAWLALGDFKRGWAGYEWRFRQTAADNRVVKRAFPCPEWQGEDLAGKSILIWAEQGISDQIQFAGMFNEIVGMAYGCVIECPRKLAPLLARSVPEASIVPLADPAHPGIRRKLDFHVAAGSAARWLRPTLERFPQRAGYLVADEARVGHWRQRLQELGPGLKVGFSWRSGNLKGMRALFSTRLEHWDDLFRIQDVRWVCLQYDDCEAELNAAQHRVGVTLNRFAEVDYFDDLDEVSALMCALDLVISAPTAVSIQAAALGVEVWQMNYGVDWQAHGTPGNPWFPTLVRYERRPDQPWAEILAGIARRLDARARR